MIDLLTLDGGNKGELTGRYGGPSVFRQVTHLRMRFLTKHVRSWSNQLFRVVVLEIWTDHQGEHCLIFLANGEHRCHQYISTADGHASGKWTCKLTESLTLNSLYPQRHGD